MNKIFLIFGVMIISGIMLQLSNIYNGGLAVIGLFGLIMYCLYKVEKRFKQKKKEIEKLR